MPVIALDALRELMLHMEWADANVWRALRARPEALGDAKLRNLVCHLHYVQRAFLRVWTGRSFEPPDAEGAALDTTAALRAYYSDLYSAIAAFDDEALRQPVVMPWLEPYERQMGRRFDQPTLAETMIQVTSHSTYHRGQVNARLRELGGEPPLVDFIAWIWFGKPPADWVAD